MSTDWLDDKIVDLLRHERAKPGPSPETRETIYGRVLATVTAPIAPPVGDAGAASSGGQAIAGTSAIAPKLLLILGGFCAGALGLKLVYDQTSPETPPSDRYAVHQAITPTEPVTPQRVAPQPSEMPVALQELPAEPSPVPVAPMPIAPAETEPGPSESCPMPTVAPRPVKRRPTWARTQRKRARPSLIQPTSGQTAAPPQPTPKAGPHWAAERRLIVDARVALKAGVPRLAGVHLQTHRDRFASGQLAQERDALQVRVLWALGQREAARGAGRRFGDRYPRSLLGPGIQALLGTTRSADVTEADRMPQGASNTPP